MDLVSGVCAGWVRRLCVEGVCCDPPPPPPPPSPLLSLPSHLCALLSELTGSLCRGNSLVQEFTQQQSTPPVLRQQHSHNASLLPAWQTDADLCVCIGAHTHTQTHTHRHINTHLRPSTHLIKTYTPIRTHKHKGTRPHTQTRSLSNRTTGCTSVIVTPLRRLCETCVCVCV